MNSVAFTLVCGPESQEQYVAIDGDGKRDGPTMIDWSISYKWKLPVVVDRALATCMHPTNISTSLGSVHGTADYALTADKTEGNLAEL